MNPKVKELLQKIDSLQFNLYIVYDKVNKRCEMATLNMNDPDFIRCNLPIIRSRWQLQDIEVFNLGSVDKILKENDSNFVDWSCYQFETEAQNLARLGMKQEEIEAYFAERSKKNRGMTEKEIVSIMENLIAQKANKKE